VRKIKVVVANRPRLMREMVLATISDKPDIEVVGETDRDSKVIELVEETRPDFLIIGLEDQKKQPPLCGFLLGRYPDMKILAVAAETNSAIFYSAFVDIRSTPVESSEQGILDALRRPTERLKSSLPSIG